MEKEEKLKLIIDISDTLVYMHYKRMVHRDVKPSNILVNRHKKPKLSYVGSEEVHIIGEMGESNM